MNSIKNSRIIRAFKHTADGLKALWLHEQAFRQEIYVGMLLFPLLVIMTIPFSLKLFLISLLLLLLVIEALNSALEAVVDRISLEIHPQSKLAKDMGSAAVGLMIIINVIVWLGAIYLQFHVV